MSHALLRTSLLATVLLSLGSGCASGPAGGAAAAIVPEAPPARGCAVAYRVADPQQAIVVEGFGSAEGEQVFAHARQPVARCSKQVVQARQARLQALR